MSERPNWKYEWLRVTYHSLRRLEHSLRARFVRAIDPNVDHLTERLRRLKGRYAGQRCVIMGNGPSLNRMELDRFQDEPVWGSNKCYLLFDRIPWRPSFYIAVDTVVVPDIADHIQSLVQQLSNTFFFHPVAFREGFVLKSAPNLYWYKQKKLDESVLPDGMFSRDAAEFVYSVRTVTIAAMQLAVYLGFGPIYLIGCDTSYTLPKSVRRIGRDSKILQSTEDYDLNHFHPQYFGKGSLWRAPQVERMIFHYEQAARVCRKLGVEVYNATVGGNLEVFPRVDYRDIF